MSLGLEAQWAQLPFFMLAHTLPAGTAPTTVSRGMVLSRVTFEEITQKLGINLPASGSSAQDSSQPIKAADYSPEFARTKLLPLLGPSVTASDYDGDFHPDLYVANPGGRNQLFHNSGTGPFGDVTAQAGAAGARPARRGVRPARAGAPPVGPPPAAVIRVDQVGYPSAAAKLASGPVCGLT